VGRRKRGVILDPWQQRPVRLVLARWRSAFASVVAILSGPLALQPDAMAQFLPDSPASIDRVTRSWTVDHGLPQNSVTAVLHARDGFLWVGTNAGLARFDGVRFRKFGLQDGLRSVLITALVEDREGAVWIGTSGGGVSRWHEGRFTSFGAKEGFDAGPEVISLTADENGSIWIGTGKGLVRWSDGAFETLGESDGLPQTQVRALLQDSRGTLWASLIPGGLYWGLKGKFAPAPGRDSDTSVYTFLEDSDGAIWAGSDSLWKWSSHAWERFDTAPGQPGPPIQSIAQSTDGLLWIGRRGNGLHYFNRGAFGRFSEEGPLATQSVTTVKADREGSIWAGAVGGGLHRLAPRLLHFWDINAGVGATSATSVAEDSTGALWVGTTSRGIQRLDNGRFIPLEDPAVPADCIIYTTTAMPDGSVWAGGEQRLYRIQTGQPLRAFLDAPVRGEALRALCADGEHLWIGTYGSALLRCDGSAVEVVSPPGTFSGTITSIVREAPDTLWIGTSAGLHLWTKRGVKTWTTSDGLLTDYIRALHREEDGTLWIGTLGGGLARMKNGKFVNITTRHGLADDVISQILFGDLGGVWLGCNRGIMRIDRAELDAVADGKSTELHPLIFGRNEGMLKEQCAGGTSPTAHKSRDGRLFFPGGGLTAIDPRKVRDIAPAESKVCIENVLLDNRAQPMHEELLIPPGNHRLAIAYTSPVLRGGEWLTFRHQLEGFDDSWSSVDRTRTASYDGLPPGKYLFRVVAGNGRDGWSKSQAAIAFTVQPYLWQTLWFRLGSVLLLVGASSAGAWYYLRRRHVRQIAALEKERKHQAELAHSSRVTLLGELSASLAHELKQPLSAILSNAQAGLRFLANDPEEVAEVRDILKDIASEDRRASEIIGRMRAMMQKGETQMESRDLNADVLQALQLLRGDLLERSVWVDMKLSSDLPPVHGDHIQLQQVLLNLVVNGCDAMHGNSPEHRALVIETAFESSRSVRVSVADQGPGIPSGMMERVFEPFYSTKDTGLGMGLAICRAIIKSHGGRLWATNNPQGGAAFHFTLNPSGQSA
jgi:ligand-binding sensor domain-containing protein/signal transduction histidine kinase